MFYRWRCTPRTCTESKSTINNIVHEEFEQHSMQRVSKTASHVLSRVPLTARTPIGEHPVAEDQHLEKHMTSSDSTSTVCILHIVHDSKSR